MHEEKEDIVQAILRDRETGTARLVSEYRDKLYSVGFSLCRDRTEAEDLVFRTIERAVEMIEKGAYEERDSFYDWIRVMLLNIYRNSVRSKAAKNTVLSSGADDAENNPRRMDGEYYDGAKLIYDAIDSAILRDAIDTLPQSMKEAVLLHYFMDIPLSKMSKILSAPAGTLKSRLRLARKALAMRLGEMARKPVVATVAALVLVAVSAAVATAVARSGAYAGGDVPQPAAEAAGETGGAAVQGAQDSPEHLDGQSAPDASGSPSGAVSGDSGAEAFLDSQQEGATEMKMRMGRMYRRLTVSASAVLVMYMAAKADTTDAYVESDGRSAISTGYRVKGSSRIEVDFALTEQTAQARVFGDDANEDSLRTVLYVTGGASHFGITTGNGTSTITRNKEGTDTARHIAVIDLPGDMIRLESAEGLLVFETTTGVAGGFAGREAKMPLSLFGRYSNVEATKFETRAKARIYGVKIYEDGELVRDFAPCLKEGVACFKDLVSGAFIVGENPAAFTAGGDVPSYDDDGYVSTAANADGGKLYIDTGYKATAKTAVALDCALTVNTNLAGSIWRLFQGSSPTFDFNLNGNNGLRCQAFNGYMTDFTSAFKDTLYDDKDVRRTFILDNRGVAAVVTAGFTNQTATFTQTATATNANPIKLAANWAGNSDFAAIKIYGCKIWEDGVLVRDFVPHLMEGVPGLRDRVTGAFRKQSRGSGDTSSELAFGGTIGGENDAYLESDGTTGISTGYRMKGVSRLEMDFALTTTNDCKQWRIFGSDTQEATRPDTYLYVDGACHLSMKAPWGQKYTTVYADTNRHTAVLDLYRGNLCFMTDGVTNFDGVASAGYDYATVGAATLPLPVLSRWKKSGDDWTLADTDSSSRPAKARIYSVRLYEAGALAHELLPYARGAVTGLYDTVTGEISPAGAGFRFGGAGYDHGEFRPFIAPGYAKMATTTRPVALTAFCPGVETYRWYMDGAAVAGASNATLSAKWTKSGATNEYSVSSLYEINGIAKESEKSETAKIASAKLGMAIYVQ